jgi:hypothetical protein
MKNKKEMSIRLRKRSIANLSYVQGGNTPPEETTICTNKVDCPTTVDPRTNPVMASNQC